MAALGTNKLTISIEGTEVAPQVSTVEITAAETESDFISFADAAAGGGRDYKLHLVATQDMATDSVWDKVWSAAGTEVDVVVRPGGATGPTFTGTCVVKEPDGVILGGEADPSNSAKFTIDVEWDFLAKPTKSAPV